MPRLATLRPYLTGFIIAMVALVTAVWLLRGRADPETLIAIEPIAEGQSVTVFVGGAVARPGVYTLPRGERVEAAIAAAGGFHDEADQDAVNRAVKLRDEGQIIVPRKGEQPVVAAGATATAPMVGASGSGSGMIGANTAAATNSPARINVNTAPVAELERLPGVGPRLAQQIVDYRAANGPFATPADLAKVRGISDKMVEGWGDTVTCGP